MTTPFKLVPRPRFAQWMFDRNLVPAQLAMELKVSGETIRRYCLPIGHVERRRPHDSVMRRIETLTDGAITAEDFPPIARPRPAADLIQAEDRA